MTGRLQDAVKSVTAPPELAERIRSEILAAGIPRKRAWPGLNYAFYYAAAAAALLALTVGVVGYRQGHFRYTEASRVAYVDAIASRVDHVMSLGLCDHVHCAVFREYTQDPPSFEELGWTLGPADADLIPAVQGHVPEGYRLVMAHHCSYKGRPFTHLTFRDGKKVLSLVIAKRGADEWIGADQVRAALTQAGLTFYESSVQKYRIAAFETPGHLVYVVSDLSPEKNLQVLADLAPSVRAALHKREG
jgi:hypothetical protein